MLRVMLAAAMVSSFAIAVPAVSAEPAAPGQPPPTTPAPTPDATPTPTPAAGEADKGSVEDPNRIVCTRERIVGSNRPKKVCMTAAERNRLRAAARDALDPTRFSGGTAGPGGPS